MPIRREVSFGGRLGGGVFRMSCSRAIRLGTSDYRQDLPTARAGYVGLTYKYRLV